MVRAINERELATRLLLGATRPLGYSAARSANLLLAVAYFYAEAPGGEGGSGAPQVCCFASRSMYASHLSSSAYVFCKCHTSHSLLMCSFASHVLYVSHLIVC